MGESKHKPTPWEAGRSSNGLSYKIFHEEKVIASSSWHENSKYFPSQDECEANFEFIVKACNAHDKLVEALRKALLWTDAENDVGEWRKEARLAMALAAREPLSKAEGTQP